MDGGPGAAEWRALSAFMDAASVIVPRCYVPQCCLAATRIAVEALGRCHIPVRPLVVRVTVHNPPLVAKGRPPASAQEAQQWRQRDNAAAVTCGARSGGRPGRWPGHLVAIALERCLIDLSLPQVNRPDKAIELTPLLCSVSDSFLSAQEALSCLLNGCRIFYEALPDDLSYVGVGDWHDATAHRHAIDAICKSLDRALSAP